MLHKIAVYDFARVIRRAVVHNDPFHRQKRLIDHRLDCLLDESVFVTSWRDQNIAQLGSHGTITSLSPRCDPVELGDIMLRELVDDSLQMRRRTAWLRSEMRILETRRWSPGNQDRSPRL